VDRNYRHCGAENLVVSACSTDYGYRMTLSFLKKRNNNNTNKNNESDVTVQVVRSDNQCSKKHST
jgi:hypothetical protein